MPSCRQRASACIRESGQRLKVSSRTSKRMISAPSRANASAVAEKVNDGTNTASPGPIPIAAPSSHRASVPLDTPTQWRYPAAAASSSSRASTCAPPMYSPLGSTPSTASSSRAISSGGILSGAAMGILMRFMDFPPFSPADPWPSGGTAARTGCSTDSPAVFPRRHTHSPGFSPGPPPSGHSPVHCG